MRAFRAPFVALLVIGLCAMSARAVVVFHQVEGSAGSYAPVNFNGNATVAGAGEFTGVTFHAIPSPPGGTTFTFHSERVAREAFGDPVGKGQPYIADSYHEYVNNFLAVVNTQAGPSTSAPMPGFFGFGIDVSNHSWAGDWGSDAAAEDAVRRLDFMTDREDVVMVSSAVRGGSFPTLNTPWPARNGIAVAGALNIFEPTASPVATVGKTHGDVWHENEASFSAARVSGYAAGLLGEAQTAGFADAQHNQVIKSIIMTGADKTAAASGNVAAWTRDTANHLDVNIGTGKADYNKSSSILAGGERTVHTVIGGTTITGATASTALRGWSYPDSAITTDSAIVIEATGTITSLTATLNWNVTQAAGTLANTLNTTDAGRIFADLNLELRPLTLNAGVFTVGPSLGNAHLLSAATNDNVEHLYFTGNLAPGYYAFYIDADASTATRFGFSYDLTVSSVIPEPATTSIFAVAAAFLLARRRRN